MPTIWIIQLMGLMQTLYGLIWCSSLAIFDFKYKKNVLYVYIIAELSF